MKGDRGPRKMPHPDKVMCFYCGTWLKEASIDVHSKEFSHPDVSWLTYDDYIKNLNAKATQDRVL